MGSRAGTLRRSHGVLTQVHCGPTVIQLQAEGGRGEAERERQLNIREEAILQPAISWFSPVFMFSKRSPT